MGGALTAKMAAKSTRIAAVVRRGEALAQRTGQAAQAVSQGARRVSEATASARVATTLKKFTGPATRLARWVAQRKTVKFVKKWTVNLAYYGTSPIWGPPKLLVLFHTSAAKLGWRGVERIFGGLKHSPAGRLKPLPAAPSLTSQADDMSRLKQPMLEGIQGRLDLDGSVERAVAKSSAAGTPPLRFPDPKQRSLPFSKQEPQQGNLSNTAPVVPSSVFRSEAVMLAKPDGTIWEGTIRFNDQGQILAASGKPFLFRGKTFTLEKLANKEGKLTQGLANEMRKQGVILPAGPQP
jgi:hypothetical protein